MTIKAASGVPFFSQRRRDKLDQSAAKRLNRLAARIEQITGSADSGSESRPVETTADNPATAELASLGDVRPHQGTYRILLICGHAPTVNHAGGLRILDIVRLIKLHVPNSHVEIFAPANKKLYGPLDKAILLADKVVLTKGYDFSLNEYKRRTNAALRHFDVVDFQFPQPLDVIKDYRSVSRKIIFTPMESLIRNEIIDRKTEGGGPGALESEEALLEQQIVDHVDLTVSVSKTDMHAISEFTSGKVCAIETGISEIEFRDDARVENAVPLNVCYVAYFGSDTNRKALEWYLAHVHPIVRDAVPGYTFSIVGRGEIGDILPDDMSNISHVGSVPSVAPYIRGATIGIAPALSGSGFRGKINQYAYLRVPVVASPLSANGLAYSDEENILVAETAGDFAERIIRLLTDADLRESMANAAYEVATREYTWEARWPQVAEAYSLPTSIDLLPEPSVHAIVPSYQHGTYLADRIRSIFEQEYSNLRVTVIDDCSDDNSDEVIRALQSEFGFDYVRRDRNSGTPFSAWQHAAETTEEDLVWICESDDTAHPMFLPKMVKAMAARDTTRMAYCASWVIDEHGHRIGSTDTYHMEHFHPTRWRVPFVAQGPMELMRYARFGMVVPNMSSAIFDAEVFRKAFTPDIKSYRLAGDWLFLGQALQHGDVAFVPDRLNSFRRHEQTSRQKTNLARQVAEHASVRLKLSKLVGASELEMLDATKHDLNILRNTPKIWPEVLETLRGIDPDNAQTLELLHDLHVKEGTASEDLARALVLKAPLPVSQHVLSKTA